MATESCDYQLAADLAANCTVKPVKGIKSHGYIMNYNDIDFEATTRDATNPNIVKALILKTGAKAYKMYVPGKSPYTGTKKSMVAGTYRNRFNKDVSIVILDNGPDVSHNIIDQLANGTFVVVLETKFAGADMGLRPVLQQQPSMMTNTPMIPKVVGSPHFRRKTLRHLASSSSENHCPQPAQPLPLSSAAHNSAYGKLRKDNG